MPTRQPSILFFIVLLAYLSNCQNVTTLEDRGTFQLSELGGQNFQFTSSAMLDESRQIQLFLGGTTTKILVNIRTVQRNANGVVFKQEANWIGESGAVQTVLDVARIVVMENQAFGLFAGKSIGIVSLSVVYYVPLVRLPSGTPTLPSNNTATVTPAPPLSDPTFAYTTFIGNKNVFSLVYQAIYNDTTCLYHNLLFVENGTYARDTKQLVCTTDQTNMKPVIFEDRQVTPIQFYMYYMDSRGGQFLSICAHVDDDTGISCQPEVVSLPSDITVQKMEGISVGLNLYYVAYLTDSDLQIGVFKYARTANMDYTKPIVILKSSKVQFKLQANDEDATVTVLAYDTDTKTVHRIVVGLVSQISGRPDLAIIELYKTSVPDYLELSIGFAEVVPSVFSMTVAKDVGAAVTQFFSYPYCGDILLSDGESCDSTANCQTDCTCPKSFEATAGTCIAPPMTQAVTPVSTVAADVNTIVPAVIVPVCAVGIGTGLLIFFLRRKDKKKKEKKEDAKKEIEMDTKNPTYNSIPTPAGSSTTSGGSSNNTTQSSNNPDDRMNIPYSELKFSKEIGVGGFGKVFLGEWQKTQVALKISSLASSEEFLREAELLINLRPHPNVVQVLGVSNDGINVVMIMEYCEEGSVDRIVMRDNCPLTPKQKIELISGIAKGIYHLHRNNIIHRDLASRNVLMSRGQPKISDFGMSRKLQESTGLGKTNTSVGPIRWMAPESLKDTVYSTKTDVWSFGIVCWEIFSGREPHAEADAFTIGKAIRDEGLTPKCEENWDPFIVELMQKCWSTNPDNRPDFEDICSELQKHLETAK